MKRAPENPFFGGFFSPFDVDSVYFLKSSDTARTIFHIWRASERTGFGPTSERVAKSPLPLSDAHLSPTKNVRSRLGFGMSSGSPRAVGLTCAVPSRIPRGSDERHHKGVHSCLERRFCVLSRRSGPSCRRLRSRRVSTAPNSVWPGPSRLRAFCSRSRSSRFSLPTSGITTSARSPSSGRSAVRFPSWGSSASRPVSTRSSTFCSSITYPSSSS